MDNKFVNGTMLSDFAKKIKNNIKTDLLDGKKLKYVTQAEYDALTDDKKNDENIIYNITDADIQEGFSGDYNDLENRPCYQDKGDIPEYLNIEIYPDTDFSDKEYVEVINGTADNGNCIIYRKYVKLFSDITIDMINTMKEYGVFISKYEGQLIENPLIDLLDESQADQGMYSIGREFEFILQAPEGYYLPENGLWYEESYIDRDLNGNLIAEYKTVDDFEGILLIKDNGKLNTVTIKQLDEKFIPDTIATKKYVDDAESIKTVTPSSFVDLYNICKGINIFPAFYKIQPTSTLSFTLDTRTVIVSGIWQVAFSSATGRMTFIGTSTECSFVLTADGFNQSSIKYLTTNNTVEYTPTNDYNPATKKYVDNKIAGLQIVRITKAEYNALATRDPNTLYLIVE